MMGLQEIDQRTDDDEGTLRGYKMAGATTTTEISGVRWGQFARPQSKRFPLSLWVCLVVVTLRREVTRVIPPLRTESFSALLADRSFRDSFPCCQAMAACSSFHRANTHTHPDEHLFALALRHQVIQGLFSLLPRLVSTDLQSIGRPRPT